jgi:hypothetical protein
MLRLLLGPILLALAPLVSAQSSGVVIDASGAVVGLFADEGIIHSHRGFRATFNFQSGRIISEQNLVDLTDVGGIMYQRRLLFASINCSGQAYVGPEGSRGVGGVVVLAAENPYSLYYAPKGSAVASPSIQSVLTPDGQCSASPVGVTWTLPAFPNDPAVTGFPSEPFLGPLRLEIQPLGVLFDLFQHGFEGVLSPLAQELADRVV